MLASEAIQLPIGSPVRLIRNVKAGPLTIKAGSTARVTERPTTVGEGNVKIELDKPVPWRAGSLRAWMMTYLWVDSDAIEEVGDDD